MAYIRSKEFKVLLEEIVKMLKEGKSDEVIKMLEEKIKKAKHLQKSHIIGHNKSNCWFNVF